MIYKLEDLRMLKKSIFVLISLLINHAWTLPQTPPNGGTGINNCAGCTITLGGPFKTTGMFSVELFLNANTALTLPISGTLISDANSYDDPSWITGISAGKIEGDIPQSQIINLTADLNAKANDNAVVHLNGPETINDTKTFTNTIQGSISGNAATVTTNANTIGDVTSIGNVTTIANVNPNPGTAGAANTVPIITTNTKGQTTAVSTASIQIVESQVTNLPTDLASKANTNGSNATGTWPVNISGNSAGAPPTGTAGGDLTGTYPNPTLPTVNGNPGTVGAANTVPVVTTNAKGQTTAVSTATITPAAIGAPQTNGTGATGTWTINTSGNAATSTTSTNLNGGTLGSIPYQSAANTTALLAGNTLASRRFLRQTGTGSVSAAPVWDTVTTADITGAALTETNDTNVTLTLGGSPTIALLNPASLTLGWTGQLAPVRGGIGQDSSGWSQGDLPYISATGTWNHLPKSTTATQYLSNTGTSNNPAWAQINLANGVTGVNLIANGGTNSNTQTTNGIAYYNGTSVKTNSSFTYNETTGALNTTGQINAVGGPGVGASVLTDQYFGFANTVQGTPGVSTGIGASAGNTIGFYTNSALQAQVTNAGVSLTTAGQTYSIKSGTNSCIGTGASMVSGVASVSTTCAVTGRVVVVTKTNTSGIIGNSVPTVVINNGLGFTITSAAVTETSTWSWVIFGSN